MSRNVLISGFHSNGYDFHSGSPYVLFCGVFGKPQLDGFIEVRRIAAAEDFFGSVVVPCFFIDTLALVKVN